MFNYIADGQTTIFDMLYPAFKIDKPIRLIELFAGIGSQAMALRDLGVDFEKAEAVNSNSRLYKQSGNSIVKAVLMAIFKQML